MYSWSNSRLTCFIIERWPLVSSGQLPGYADAHMHSQTATMNLDMQNDEYRDGESRCRLFFNGCLWVCWTGIKRRPFIYSTIGLPFTSPGTSSCLKTPKWTTNPSRGLNPSINPSSSTLQTLKSLMKAPSHSSKMSGDRNCCAIMHIVSFLSSLVGRNVQRLAQVLTRGSMRWEL